MKKLTSCIVLLLTVNFMVHGQNALDFDGSDDMIQTNCDGVTGNANRTFEAWIWVPSSAPASNLCILDYGSSATASRNTFMVNGSRGLSFIAGGVNTNISSTNSVITDDVWTHVAMVLENGTGYFYVNGVAVGSGNLSGVITPSGQTGVRIGERVSGGSIPFKGKIDEVRVWNVARTQTEIQSNMNGELCQGSSNLLLYLQLDQGTAGGNNSGLTNVIDYSNNGISGTMTGFALNGATSNWVAGAVLTPGMNGDQVQASACNSYTWPANNQTYNSSGTYTTVLTNTAGCDSILNLQLTINTANDATTTQTACDSYFWSVNGQTYTASDTIVENLTAGNGCAYTHTLRLTINYSYEKSDTIVACDNYVWAANGQTYSATGVYTENLTTVKGCDSTLILDLTISTIDNTVTVNGDSTLTANEASASYQWLYCDSNYAIIPGATAQTYTALVDGLYAVEVSNGVCKDTSNCVVVDYLAVEEMELMDGLTIYPNPTQGYLSIDFGRMTSGQVTVVDLKGSVVLDHNFVGMNQMDLNLDVKPGVYTVVISEDTGKVSRIKITKL